MGKRDLKKDLELVHKAKQCEASDLKFNSEGFLKGINALTDFHIDAVEIAEHALKRALIAEYKLKERTLLHVDEIALLKQKITELEFLIFDMASQLEVILDVTNLADALPNTARNELAARATRLIKKAHKEVVKKGSS